MITVFPCCLLREEEFEEVFKASSEVDVGDQSVKDRGRRCRGYRVCVCVVCVYVDPPSGQPS